MASVRGDKKLIFIGFFGRPGIAEVSSSAEPDRWEPWTVADFFREFEDSPTN